MLTTLFFFLSSLFLSSVPLIPLSHTRMKRPHTYSQMQTRGLWSHFHPCCHNLQCFKSKVPFNSWFLLSWTGYWPKETVRQVPAYCSQLHHRVYLKLSTEIQEEPLVIESGEGFFFYDQIEMKQLCGSLLSPIKVRWESLPLRWLFCDFRASAISGPVSFSSFLNLNLETSCKVWQVRAPFQQTCLYISTQLIKFIHLNARPLCIFT